VNCHYIEILALASFLQTIHLTGRWNQVREKLFVYATGWSDSPFPPTVARLRTMPDWRVEALPIRHNIIAAARLVPGDPDDT
jgi:hypothetical protein